ncbi:MAG: molybdopterin-dependent oxidoreductase [Nitrospirales bacterium]|nr:molybdopterin-dependent oxidoreductase [Nitrospirales bacterium]
MIELTINGKVIQTEPGTTILEASLKNGIYIPTMCYDKRLKPYGGCRLCVVEVEGQPKLLASCSTPAEEGMIVETETPRIAKARKTVLELLLVHHPLDCPVCDKAGECDLQDLAFKYGPSQSRFLAVRKHAPERTDSPIVESNPNRCILCGKCVRVCSEHQGASAISIIGKGFTSKISPPFEETLDCEFCGQCIDACPVGALGSKSYRFRSRVWFMDEFATLCPYCGCGCTTNVGIQEGKIIRARGKEGVGINDGNLCSKGRYGFDYIYSENRLRTPLIRKNGDLTPASWQEALEYVIKGLDAVRTAHGPEAIGAIGSQRCTMEDNFMLQRFMRDVMGTDNVDSAARFGYAKAHDAMQRVLGAAHPIGWDAPSKANFILVVESDITSTLPVWGLNFIKARNNGAKLVIADHKETKLARQSSQWLRIRPGSGDALLRGMMKIIVEEGLSDPKRISGIKSAESFLKGLKELDQQDVEKITGLSWTEIGSLARSYASSDGRLVAVTSNASENTKGISTFLSAASLVLLMGDDPGSLQVPAEYSNTLGAWAAGVRPLSGGLDAEEMIYGSMPVKGLYIMGENPLVTFPDAAGVERALKGMELLVVQDIFLTETAKLAHVVLPACSWGEKEGEFMAATGIVQQMPKLLPETGQAIPDWKIFRNMARLMNRELGLMELRDVRSALRESPTSDKGEGLKQAFPELAPLQDVAAEIHYPLRLVTANILQHSGALSVLSKNLDSVVPDAFVQIHPHDAGKYGIDDAAFVRVTSRKGEILLKAMVSEEVMEGTVFTPLHFGHARANILTEPPVNGEIPVVMVRIEKA